MAQMEVRYIFRKTNQKTNLRVLKELGGF